MKNIHIIGDTHGEYEKILATCTIKNITDSLIIQVGDFGFICGRDTHNKIEKLYKLMKERNNVLAFIDGNHENFELLNFFDEEEFCGGKIHRIAPNIIHLMRGQVFDFDGKTFFTLGGADSIDKGRRVNRVTWWKEENITASDMKESFVNLEKHNFEVNYVITHTCPFEIKKMLFAKVDYDNSNERILSAIGDEISFEHWFFGHFHMDEKIDQYTCLYDMVATITERGIIYDFH